MFLTGVAVDEDVVKVGSSKTLSPPQDTVHHPLEHRRRVFWRLLCSSRSVGPTNTPCRSQGYWGISPFPAARPSHPPVASDRGQTWWFCWASWIPNRTSGYHPFWGWGWLGCSICSLRAGSPPDLSWPPASPSGQPEAAQGPGRLTNKWDFGYLRVM